MKYGSAGVGSTGHLFCELLHAALGIGSVTHVPYRGGGPAMQDLIAGRYDYICTLSPTGKPLIDANTVKGIAILQPKRSPEIPKPAEHGRAGPARFRCQHLVRPVLPEGHARADRPQAQCGAGGDPRHPWVHERFKDIVANVAPREERSPEYLKKLVDSDTAKMGAAIRAAGIQQF